MTSEADAIRKDLAALSSKTVSPSYPNLPCTDLANHWSSAVVVLDRYLAALALATDTGNQAPTLEPTECSTVTLASRTTWSQTAAQAQLLLPEQRPPGSVLMPGPVSLESG